MAATLASLASRLNAGGLPSLVLMTDDERLPDPLGAARNLPKGSLIVLRARERARRFASAVALAAIAREKELFLVIADDPELAVFADGAHFSERRAGEISYWRARRPHWLITTSAHSLRAAMHASTFGADAVFLSPVFATKSHPGRAPIGPLRLRMMADQLRIPIYALGGIGAHSALRLAGAGLAGYAAIGALSM